MKRLLCTFLLCAFLFTLPAGAAVSVKDGLWTRPEDSGNGEYVTIRIPYPDGLNMKWAETRNLYARYADTKEPISLCSSFKDGFVFVTVRKTQANRPMEVVLGEPLQFEDCFDSWVQYGGLQQVYSPPLGTSELNLRGIILGNGANQLMPDEVITRAEAFTIICRLMGIPLEGDLWTDWFYVNGGYSGFKDVDRMTDWFYPTAAASKVYGITNEPEYFRPNDLVSRGEVTVMLYRALKTIGWLRDVDGTNIDLSFKDSSTIPSWALDAYLAFEPHNVKISTVRDSDIIGEFGPEQDAYAEQSKGATREEVINLVYDALRWVPYYPTQTAIDWGFDKEMPVIDGSTSTLPYTHAVYGALFSNGDNHPSRPEKHSKSYYSYERLINGEADLLFIAAKPTQDTIEQAAAAGVELEFIPIAYDAMVFFTNGENPVNNLTTQQIKDIYVKNAYDNWADIGGPDAGLIPYCRNADSGSQALMEEFFLDGGDIHPDIRKETTSLSMASVLTDVWQAKTDAPPAYGLGYSIYYYYQSASRILLSGDDDLKLLSIDGVAPNDKTIANGTYPLAGYNYIAIRADQPKGSPARKMVDFMLSDAGQVCVINAGFGALQPSIQEYLSELMAKDIKSITWPVESTDRPTKQEVVTLLKAAAKKGTEEAPAGADQPMLWYLELNTTTEWSPDDTIYLYAGLEENLVKLVTGDHLPGNTFWMKDNALYQMIRTSMDTPDGSIDEEAYTKYQTTVDSFVDAYTVSSAGITLRPQLNAFYLCAENVALNAQAYAVDVLGIVTPAEKAYVLLAGGQYVDSQLRIHGVSSDSCLIVLDGQVKGFYSREWVDNNFVFYKTKLDLLADL